MPIPRFWPLILGTCLVCGCADSPTPDPAGANDSPGPGTTETANEEPTVDPTPSAGESEPSTGENAPASEVVELQLLEWQGVEELIASHGGKVVVVDLWATYCAPCIREFPGLVSLSETYPDDVACISVSLDDEDDQEAALTFLQEHNATFDNVLCTTDPDTLYDEILKVGAIPVIYVYGRNGEMLKRFTSPTEDGSEVSYEGHIVPFVEELLAEG